MASLLEADRLRELRSDPVLVPRDVPGDRDHDLAADTRERADARLGLAEALRDPGDRAAEVRLVEEVGGLDDLALRLGQPPEDRLIGNRRLRDRRPARLEQARQAEPPARPVGRHRRSRWAPLLQPPVLERDVLAERADVDEVLAVGGEAGRPLPHQQGALAYCAAAS